MTLTSLGYIGIQSSRLADWDGFATDLLGMQKVDGGTAQNAFRMDDRKQRLIVSRDDSEGLAFMDGKLALLMSLRNWCIDLKMRALPSNWKATPLPINAMSDG